MDINSLQGSAAYANSPTPPVDNTATREQNLEAANTKLNTEKTSAAQEAFEVTISQDALEKTNKEKTDQKNFAPEQLAAKTAEQTPAPVEPNQTAQTQPPNDQAIPAEQDASPIVNIVA